jgi:hypothetical protein
MALSRAQAGTEANLSFAALPAFRSLAMALLGVEYRTVEKQILALLSAYFKHVASVNEIWRFPL